VKIQASLHATKCFGLRLVIDFSEGCSLSVFSARQPKESSKVLENLNFKVPSTSNSV
jgi:hypothetical protein